MDHCSRPDGDAVVDDQLIFGKQVQDGVLEDLDIVADPDGAVGVADDLYAGANYGAFAYDDVSRDLGGWEQHGRGSDRRCCVAVGVELTHTEALQCRSDGGEAG